MAFSHIPTELILEIARQLPARDLSILSRTSHTLAQLLIPLLLRCVTEHHVRCSIMGNRPDSVCSILRSPNIITRNSGTVRLSAFDLVGWLLYFGVRYGTPEIVSILMLHGIPIDQPVGGINYRITSLQRAVRRGSIEIVTLLLDAGAQVDRTTEHSRGTPLYLACLYHREDIANLLINHGARLDGGVLATAGYYDCGAILQRVLDLGIPVDSAYVRPWEAPIVTALQYLCMNSPTTCAMVKLLLDKGADVNRGSGGIYFPLLGAVRGGNPAVVILLLDFGADRDVVCGGQTPAALAMELGNSVVLDVLLRYGSEEP